MRVSPLPRAAVSRPAGLEHAGPDALPVLALAAIGTTFMLEAMRVFVSYLVFVVDQSNRGTLAAIVLAVFLACGLSAPLVRLLGARQAVLLSAAGLALARVALQFWGLPIARVVLGAAVVIGWAWLVVALLGARRAPLALGTGAGLVLDLAVRIAFGTVDLPWSGGIAAHAVTLVLAGGFVLGLAAFARDARDGASGYGSALPLIGVGPALALHHLITGNLGVAQTRLDAGFPAAAAVLAAGAALGLAASIWPRALPSARVGPEAGRGGAVLAAALGALGLWLIWQGSALAPLALAALGAANLYLLARTLSTGAPAERQGSLAGTTGAFTAGLLLQAGVLFAYYTFTGRPSLMGVALALLALGAVAGGASPIPSARWSGRARAVPAGLGALVALPLVLSGAQFVGRPEPTAGPPLGSEITIMTYNIQNGFSLDDEWALERIARTIEAEQPDVVVLQEVSRGWLVSSGVDEILWLSQRLGMPYVFGPNSDDGLWGNAILTRAPVRDVGLRQYTTTQNLKRSAIEVRLATEAGDLWVFGTHLDDPAGAEEVRLSQVNELIDFWGGREPALIFGDLNSEPDDEVLARLAAAGFSDLGASLDPSAYTSDDRRRIDYILGTPGVEVREIHVPDSRASDHRPVVATIAVRP